MEKNALIISGLIDWVVPLTIGFHIIACKSPGDTDSGKAWRKLALINTIAGLLLMIVAGLGYILVAINALFLVLIALDDELMAACADQAALDAYSGSWTDGKGTPVVEDLEA
jgi:hypothetical protein